MGDVHQLSDAVEWQRRTSEEALARLDGPHQGSERDGMDGTDQDLVDAKLAAVEARTDTKFAQVLGKLDGISAELVRVNARLDQVQASTATVKWNIIASGLALGGLILGLAAYGQAMLSLAASLVGAKH